MTDTLLLKNTLVKDLAWAITSPPIIQGQKHLINWTKTSDWTQAYEKFKAQLKALDQDPSKLTQLLNKQNDYRLGHYFETLFRYWFEHNDRYQLLIQNLQIRDAGKTLGEFDFIVKDAVSGNVQHWEVACKFYLGIKNTPQHLCWVGPMLKDRLDIKYKSMQTRQSKLSAHPVAKQQLQQLNISIDEHVCLMKGRLFHPIDTSSSTLPQLIANTHQRGQWVRANHFLENFKSSAFQWQPLTKNQWLASQPYNANETYYRAEDILQYFLDKTPSGPLCLSGFLPDQSTSHEVKRIFLVGKDWANTFNFNDNTVLT